jgi:hypothetical protein
MVSRSSVLTSLRIRHTAVVSRFAVDATAFLELARIGVQPPNHQLVGTAGLRSQTLSLLYRQTRAEAAAADNVAATMLAITTLKARLLGDRVSRATAWKIAIDLNLEDTAQAEILAVAQLQADALITFDDRLRELAAGRVKLASFNELA